MISQSNGNLAVFPKKQKQNQNTSSRIYIVY